MGRLLNHSLKGNVKARLVSKENMPVLIFEANRAIAVDEELVYDYGDRDATAIKENPWLRK